MLRPAIDWIPGCLLKACPTQQKMLSFTAVHGFQIRQLLLFQGKRQPFAAVQLSEARLGEVKGSEAGTEPLIWLERGCLKDLLGK